MKKILLTCLLLLLPAITQAAPLISPNKAAKALIAKAEEEIEKGNLSKGDSAKVVKLFQEATKKDTKSDTAPFKLGMFLLKNNRDSAKKAFQTAAGRNPQNLMATLYIGMIEERAGEMRTAKKWYKKSLKTYNHLSQEVEEKDKLFSAIGRVMVLLIADSKEAAIKELDQLKGQTSPFSKEGQTLRLVSPILIKQFKKMNRVDLIESLLNNTNSLFNLKL